MRTYGGLPSPVCTNNPTHFCAYVPEVVYVLMSYMLLVLCGVKSATSTVRTYSPYTSPWEAGHPLYHNTEYGARQFFQIPSDR